MEAEATGSRANSAKGNLTGRTHGVASASATLIARKLRYHRQIAELDGCGSVVTRSVPFTESSYRIVHEPPEGADFHPVALLDPGRLRGESSAACCKMWSLSMWESLEKLLDHLARSEKLARKLKKKVGDHVARLELTDDHGWRTEACPRGHFSFYECDSFDPVSVVRERVPLP